MYLNLETGKIISIRNMINKFYKKRVVIRLHVSFTQFTVSSFVEFLLFTAFEILCHCLHNPFH